MSATERAWGFSDPSFNATGVWRNSFSTSIIKTRMTVPLKGYKVGVRRVTHPPPSTSSPKHILFNLPVFWVQAESVGSLTLWTTCAESNLDAGVFRYSDLLTTRIRSSRRETVRWSNHSGLGVVPWENKLNNHFVRLQHRSRTFDTNGSSTELVRLSEPY